MAERYARMEGNVVAEVFEFEPVLHPSLEVVAVPEEVEPNWRREEGVFHPPALIVIEPVPVSPVITFKADIWRRCTDEEAASIDEALKAATIRQRRLFEDAQYLDHADEAFAFAHAALVSLFGETRASELLAAS